MTQAISVFELTTEVVRLHERSTAGRITVVPVLVDDLEVARPALEAVATVLSGRFFDAGGSELQGPVPGTTNPIRIAAVEGALTTVPSGNTRRVVLNALPGGLIDAAFIDPPVGVDPSPGERTVLAVARAISHSDLDSYDFAVLVYSDSAIDLPFRRAAWSLMVDQLADMPHPTLKTLVVVVESGIDVELHCQTGRGFQLALDDARWVRRQGRDDLVVTATQLAQLTEPFVVFLGAGFAQSSRLPLGDGLRNSAIRRLLNIDPAALHTSEELAGRFHGWIAPKPGWLTASEAGMREDDYAKQLTLEQVIRAEKRLYPELPTLAEFRAHHDLVIGTPGSAVTDLASILEGTEGRPIIVEVNFDRLVEVHSLVPLKVFSSDEDFEEASDYVEAYLAGRESDVPLLKLHGDINAPDTCVVSDEQTEAGVGAGKLRALRTLLHDPPNLWIYVGVSMRDRDLLPIFRGEDFARGIDERWVSPYLAETVATFALGRMPFWQERQFRTIDDRLVTETADAFFSAWNDAL